MMRMGVVIIDVVAVYGIGCDLTSICVDLMGRLTCKGLIILLFNDSFAVKEGNLRYNPQSTLLLCLRCTDSAG